MDEINALLEGAAERGAARGAAAVWDGAVATLERIGVAQDTGLDLMFMNDDESDVIAPEQIVERSHHARRWLAVAAAAVVLCGAGVLKLAVVHRDANHPAVSTAARGTWPMTLAPDLVPFYEAGDGLPADLTGPHDEAGLASLRCTTWTLAGTSVLCSALDDPGPDGILPAVSYRSADGRRSVDIFTRHVPVDPAAYAHELSQGKDVGYGEPPLPQSPIKVRDTSGWLAEPGNDVLRVVWNEPDGLLVALEGHGLTVGELTAIADGLRPGDLGNRAVPLVFADSGRQADGRRVLASGFIRDGAACLLFEPERVCVARPPDQVVLLSRSSEGMFAGITDGRAVAVVSAVGNTRHMAYSFPSLSFTAFAFVDDEMASLDAVDSAGRSVTNPDTSALTVADSSIVTIAEDVSSSSTFATAPPHTGTTLRG